MPYIKILIKEEIKFSKQENDIVNSNKEIIKSLEKVLKFLKQELVNKLIEMYTLKICGNRKENSNGSIFDLDTDLLALNSRLVDETIISCSNIQDSSVSYTINCESIYQHLKLVKNKIKCRTLRKS